MWSPKEISELTSLFRFFYDFFSMIREFLNFQRPAPGFFSVQLEIMTDTDKWLILQAGKIIALLENS